MKKKEEKKPFVSREDGAKARAAKNQPATVTVLEQTTDIAVAKKNELAPFMEYAKTFVVTNEADYETAANTLLKVKEVAKLAEEEKDKVIKPLDTRIKAEKKRWKPFEDFVEQINDLIRPKMLTWFNAKEKKAADDLAALNKQVASGNITKPDTIAKKEDAIYAAVPATRVNTGIGAAGVSKVKKLVIVDLNLIPDEYWKLDEVKLRDAVLKKEIEVPGATWELTNQLSII